MMMMGLLRSHVIRRRMMSSFAGIPSDSTRVTAVLGGQWGDEGKGTSFFAKSETRLCVYVYDTKLIQSIKHTNNNTHTRTFTTIRISFSFND